MREIPPGSSRGRSPFSALAFVFLSLAGGSSGSNAAAAAGGGAAAAGSISKEEIRAIISEGQEVLAARFQRLLLNSLADDAASAATPPQYEERGRLFLAAQFERRFGLRILGNVYERAAGELRVAGLDDSDSPRSSQWDFRAPVNVNDGAASHPRKADDFVIYPAKELYVRPGRRERARILTPTKTMGSGGVLVDVSSDYMAVFEVTNGEFSRSQRKPGLLQRLEERLRISLDRAHSIDGSISGILDVVAVVGVVSPFSCHQHVGEKCVAAAFPRLFEMMAAARFVWLKLNSADEGVSSGGGGGGGSGGGGGGGGGVAASSTV